jgi:hypothetical protein
MNILIDDTEKLVFMQFSTCFRMGTMTHTCNPIYLQGGNQDNGGSRQPRVKIEALHLNKYARHGGSHL